MLPEGDERVRLLFICLVLIPLWGCVVVQTTPGGMTTILAAGQVEAHLEEEEAPAVEVCILGRDIPQVVVWGPEDAEAAAERCVEMRGKVKRSIDVEGGSISSVLAWLAAMIFTKGAIGAIP